MRGLIAILIATLALGACAAAPKPERPECLEPTEKPPIDGGIGGTGNQEDCEADDPRDA